MLECTRTNLHVSMDTHTEINIHTHTHVYTSGKIKKSSDIVGCTRSNPACE